VAGFRDQVQGPFALDVAWELGDFILQRADGVFAYQLAVVVDDHHQGISQIVRGADLLVSTLRQDALRGALGWPNPFHAHLPVALDGQGRKLSKSAQACPVDPCDPLPSLIHAWHFLGQTPVPQEIGNLANFWLFARAHWSLARVPSERSRPSPSLHGDRLT
jgi:glutamyl-Q tRNA(Asp) synthetase